MSRDRLRLGPELGPDARIVERQRGDKIEHGRLARIQDGRPVPNGTEFVTLGDPDADGWHDVRTLYKHEHAPAEDSNDDDAVSEPAARDARGPAQVATRALLRGLRTHLRDAQGRPRIACEVRVFKRFCRPRVSPPFPLFPSYLDNFAESCYILA
jgi:hypothetical protein